MFIKNMYSFLRSAVFFVLGVPVFIFIRKTPAAAYQGMVNLFCLTQGVTNDLFSKVIYMMHPPYDFRQDKVQGVLGVMSEKEISKISQEIQRKGYHVFEKKLPSDYCDQLLKFALTQKCSVRPMSSNGRNENTMHMTVYNRLQPEAVRYDFDEESVINHPVVQELFCDLSLLAVAQAYLESQPVIDVTSMWWHTSFLKEPSKEAAQYFHFDMDRIKWLKFFFYLTDVTTQNGPHCFIEGSQRTKGIPRALLSQGYTRLSDDEVAKYYSREKFIEFTGFRGTIIAEDTRGLHKGKMVESGDRLVFQIQFSNSLFGAKYEKAFFKRPYSEKLERMIQKYRRIYSNYGQGSKSE